MIERRLKSAFPRIKFKVHGLPEDIEGAEKLAQANKYEFQKWVCLRINARPGGKGPDGGIDGYIDFRPDGINWDRAIVSVKGGNISVDMLRAFAQIRRKEEASIAVFVSLKEPPKTWAKFALGEGKLKTDFGEFSRLQLMTVEDIFNGLLPKIPNVDMSMTFKRAKSKSSAHEGQERLFVPKK